MNTLENVKVVSHTHNGGTDGNGTCSICGKQMAASLTAGGKTSWYTAFASAIEAANAADGAKTITLYQNVDDTVYGKRTAYELTRGPVTLATGGKRVDGVDLIAKGISLTVTGSNGSFYVTVDGKDAELTVNDKDTKLAIVTAKNGGKLSLSNGAFSRVAVKDDGSSASLSGGSYGEITSGTNYVKPYALLAKGYAYKKEDNTWVSNANIGLSKVTVEKAPFAVEKIYPNSDTNYTGNSAFATDGNITLTAVIAPETEGDTYYYWWELFNESKNDWTTTFGDVNTATHTGGQNKTLSISNLPENSSYQYRVYVQSDNGYNCYSEPFTVTRHQHSWTYTASGATITAKCSQCDASGGSVTIAAPAELTYSGEGKPATVTASSDWQGPAASGITISYIKTGTYIQQLENGALPKNAGTYTASITVGEATASVKYTIGKATPKAEDFTFTAPTSLTYDGNVKSATVSPADDVIVKYYDKDGKEATPKNAGEYTVKIDVAESTNYAAANGLTADGWKFSITKATAPMNNPAGTLNIINGTQQTYTYDFNNILPGLPGGKYGTISYGQADISLVSQSGYYYDETIVEFKKGVLTLAQFYAKDGNMTGKIGTVKVNVTTTNYENFQLKLVLYAVDQIKPEPDGTSPITASEITYGDTLSKSTISGKMKDPNTGDAVNGTFAWKDGTITPAAKDRYEAEWTFTPDAPEYATVTGTVTIKVNKATPTFTAPTAQENLTYTGQEQALIIAGSVTDYGTMQYSLTENGTYSPDIPTGTDAGAYTVWYRVIGDANHNDTAPASVAVRIGKKPLTITEVTAASKTYDGTTNAGITSVTFDNVTLTRGTDYTVTANFDDAGVGRGKNVTATVTLMGQTAKNYFLEQSSFPTTGNITKAAAPRSDFHPAVTVINGLAKTYEMVLSNDYLPELSSPCEYGNVSYSLGGTQLMFGYKDTVQVEVVEENGQYKLKLTVPAVDYNEVSSVGTLWLYVSSDNYQNFRLDIGVRTKNKDVPVPNGTISASDITYGQALNDSKIAGKMKAGSKAIDGTFTWTNGTFKPAAGDYPASWTFTPAEGYEEYATATGTATVTVNPKAVTVRITPNGGTYGSVTAAAAELFGAVEGDNVPVTLTYTGTANDGTKYTGTTPPTKAGTYTVTATITDRNYTLDADTATAKFTVAKRRATVTPDNKSKVYQEKDPELTYKVSGVLDSETLEGITLTRAEGENVGEYAITAAADAGANPNYEVTFAEGKFTIDPKSIDGATVKLGKGLAANGAEQTQTVEKVLLGDKELPADSYTVSGNTATAHGIYTLTVTGKGNYKDSVKWTYVIAPSKAEDAPGEEIAISSGKVKVVVLPEGAVPSVGLLTDKAELLAMLVNSGDITADELVQIANGASVDIVLTVKEANVSAEIKTAMAQAAKDYTIGQYLDISLFKYMTVNGIQQADALHTTKDALTISVVVPDALINTNSAVNRTYCIVRNHEGTIDVLDAAFDAAGKTLTFKTDRFSIYAIAYKDTAVPSSSSKPSSNNSSNDSETKKNEVAPTPAPTPTPTQTPANTAKPSTITATPQTGDTSNPTLYVVLLVASLLGLAVVFVCKRRNNK